MQITEHIHALRIPFQVLTPAGPLDRFVYTYLVYGESVWLVDAGVRGSEEAIVSYLRNTGRRPEEVSHLVLTHAHPDHIGAAKALHALTGCRVLVHTSERTWVEDVAVQVSERPVPGFDRLVGGSTPVAATIGHGDTLAVGESVSLHVIHTPGHSCGSVSFFIPEDGALISGDAVPLAGDLPIYEDVAASVASIRRLQGISGVEVLLSAWDEPRRGAETAQRLDGAIAWLRRVHGCVHAAKASEPSAGAIALCARVLERLNMPAAAANPLVGRSFQAHLALDPNALDAI